MGVGAALWDVRNGTLGNDIEIGAWTTGRDIGTAQADMLTRATVALRGLLALPASEARYFTARTDSAGRALSGSCSYTMSGQALSARWWSVTLYDRQGWLVSNRWNQHSAGSAGAAAAPWQLIIAPQPQAGLWIATGNDDAFELTLRTYRPSGVLASDPARAAMPTITRGTCAA